MSIYIATHKNISYNSNGYVPIQVGAELHPDLGYLQDNKGENISQKNPYYCELTALYYIWKNCVDDIMGLVHYRRYFFDAPTLKCDIHSKHKLTYEQAKKMLQSYDIILPYKVDLHATVKDNYDEFHYLSDLLICGEVIDQICPEYRTAFDEMLQEKNIYLYNMFICSRDMLSSYCEWLFSILFKCEERLNIESYDSYNKRVYGFLSERLFNVWLKKNKPKIKELPVYNTDDNKFRALKYNIKHFLSN